MNNPNALDEAKVINKRGAGCFGYRVSRLIHVKNMSADSSSEVEQLYVEEMVVPDHPSIRQALMFSF